MQGKSSASIRVFYPAWTKEELVQRPKEGVAKLSLLLPLKQVTLLGSWARGTHTVASDVDLLVTYEGAKREDAFSLVKKTIDIPCLEPHVYTEEEFTVLGPGFKATMLDGVVIYSKGTGG